MSNANSFLPFTIVLIVYTVVTLSSQTLLTIAAMTGNAEVGFCLVMRIDILILINHQPYQFTHLNQVPTMIAHNVAGMSKVYNVPALYTDRGREDTVSAVAEVILEQGGAGGNALS